MMISSRITLISARLSVWTLSAALLTSGAAKAQVSISPLLVETQANRSQAQGIITIKNNSNEAFRARLYTSPFTYDRDRGFKTLPSSPNDLSPYLQFSPRELNLPAGVTRRVRLITRFVPSLADGEYRTVVFTENLKAQTTNSDGNSVSIKSRVGVTVYVRKGSLTSNLAIASASLNSSQHKIQLLVKNTGKASAFPSVNWTLKQGEKVVTNGNIEATTVVAESERNFLLNYPGQNQPALAPGEYQLTGKLTWGQDDKKSSLPFSVNLTIPAKTTASVSK